MLKTVAGALGDLIGSRDAEDILLVVDERKELVDEVARRAERIRTMSVNLALEASPH